MIFRLGLTGSIGMGKTTAAAMFAEAGCAVWDADAAVHRLYDTGGAAVAPIGAAFPDALRDGAVSRTALKEIIGRAPPALKIIEQIVHPLLAAGRADFVSDSRADILVFDIPLLYETGGDAAMDAVVCVSVNADLQKSRVLDRGAMSEQQFEQIRARQIPDAEKRARSDYVIVTDTLDHARQQVHDIVGAIRKGMADA